MRTSPRTTGRPPRRAVVTAMAAGVAAAVTGCGAGSRSVVEPGAGPLATAPPGDPVLGLTTEIPVGGAKVYPAQRVVVTQPTAGVFVGLSAVCTHQGCVVNAVDGAAIICPCHGSRYHLDGSVAVGPAPSPLDTVPIALQGNQIVVDTAPAGPGN